MNPTGSFSKLGEWLGWLETLSPREIVLGLERVREVQDRLALRRPPLVINIAGTNGKGSCAAMLEALLRHGGVRTGCYTSPHLVAYNERTRIDGRPADDDALIAALQTVEATRREVPLTFFEFGTLATLVAFDNAGVGAWILETGMGGRLDAVNAVDPDGCLITNIALDHCAWLGDDTESIACEKAGIMRSSVPVVFGSTSVPDAIREAAVQAGAGLLLAGRDFTYEALPRDRWSWHGLTHEFHEIRRPALAGTSQLDNAAAVLALLEALGGDRLPAAAAAGAAFATLQLDGRFQRVGAHWILDVAHNAAAGQALAAALRGVKGKAKLTVIIGMLADKDVAGFVTTLGGCADEWIAVSVEGSRGERADNLGRDIANASGKPCLLMHDLGEALRAADHRAADGGRVLVTGSFRVVGPALE